MKVCFRAFPWHGAAFLAIASALPGPACAAGLVDEFTITLKQVVSNGVPGPGAGNIEVGGASDVYQVEITEPTLVFFDELAASTCALVWKCQAPDATLLFNNNAICVGDPGSIMLDQVGTYTITAYGSSPSVTGTYSVTLWQVNATEIFPIDFKQVVSNGVPGPGAGNIEEPGAIDQYTFTLPPGPPSVLAYFDEIAAGSCSINWSCQAPDATMLFSNNAMCVGDPGVLEINQPGTYTITVWGGGSATGTYSFSLWLLNPPEQFAIDLKDVVSNGVPEPGAGNIEQAGAIDVYTFSAEPGTLVFFDALSASTCSLRWSCHAPSGPLFEQFPLCVGDPGQVLIEEPGEHTITAFAVGSATGTYSFVLLELNPVESFAIELEQTVSEGVPGPGAGNIEEAGAIDEYTLTVDPGTVVFFDALAGDCDLQWECTDPIGAEVFPNSAVCVVDPGVKTLTAGGPYTIRVSGAGSASGPYSFIVWSVNAPQAFEIALDQVVQQGDPGPGAGVIEEPGATDQYMFEVAGPVTACFHDLSNECELRWECRDEAGAALFTDELLCHIAAGPGSFTLDGAYTITVSGVGDAVGPYSFTVYSALGADITGDCVVNVDDLLLVIAGWGSCPDPRECLADIDGDGSVNVDDLLAVITNWG